MIDATLVEAIPTSKAPTAVAEGYAAQAGWGRALCFAGGSDWPKATVGIVHVSQDKKARQRLNTRW